ncbi:MAG: helix-turn-helix transcriptional regulator [Lentisphaerae bacterium]|nr:helix-turn-helix transcriptional regulator [Lentisphaerota bacterium]
MDTSSQETLWTVQGFGRDRVPPGRPYWHENAGRQPAGTVVFQYTVAGALWFREGRTLRTVPRGHALLFAYGEDTGYGLTPEAAEVYRSHFLVLRGAGLKAHWDGIRAIRGPILELPLDGPPATALARLTDLARPHLAADPLDIATAVHAWVMALMREARMIYRRAQRPVDRAVDALREHPDYAWSLKEAAAAHGVSREHLARVFRARVGMPPARFLATERCRRAVSLLRNTRLPVREVARQCGYASTATLARHVRRAEGCAPNRLRA